MSSKTDASVDGGGLAAARGVADSYGEPHAEEGDPACETRVWAGQQNPDGHGADNRAYGYECS